MGIRVRFRHLRGYPEGPTSLLLAARGRGRRVCCFCGDHGGRVCDIVRSPRLGESRNRTFIDRVDDLLRWDGGRLDP